MGTVTKDFLGVLALKGKSPGSTTTRIIPIMQAMPRNPLNRVYPALVNKSAYPSQVVQGKRTPGITVVTIGKPSFLTADLLNDLLITRDSYGDTVAFSLGVWEPTTGALRVWEDARCASVSLQQGPTGELGVELVFLSRYGNNEGSFSNPFASDGSFSSGSWPTGVWQWTSAATDPGAATGIADVDFGATATLSHVRSWRLTVMVGQGHIHHIDGTVYPTEVASGMLGGSFIIEQSPVATTSIPASTNGTVTVRINTGHANKFKIDAMVYMDEYRRDHQPSFGYAVNSYSLVDLTTGGNPVTIATY